MRKFINHKNKGFTLIETLVAISIFTMSILALLVVLAQGISNTNYAKQKMIATFLAQEGIEYIRNMRDTYVLYDVLGAQTAWEAFNNNLVGHSCGTINGCYFNDQNLNYTSHAQPMAGLQIIACGGSCPAISYDVATGKYGYASGVTTGFIRKISISQISDNETSVSSTVYWVQGSGVYNMVFSESLFNWVE